MVSTVMYFSFEQFCNAAQLPSELVVEIVELGIVSPAGGKPDDWQFDVDMLSAVRRAHRLHRQLEIDWPGIALAMQLLEQLEAAQAENRLLRQRLQRFIES